MPSPKSPSDILLPSTDKARDHERRHANRKSVLAALDKQLTSG